jgi:hypothetical protein
MAKTLKNYPVTTGMSERGTRVDTPFEHLENLQRVKDSLRIRPALSYLGGAPSNWEVWETLEIDENFYEVFVTLTKDLFVFKNGTKMLQSSVWPWTGGPIQASVLGNVVAIWDPAQVVTMQTPPTPAYPNEGFIIVKTPVDYNTKVIVQSPSTTITIAIGDPISAGYPTVDAARAVEAVAKAIARGFGGGWKNVGEVAQTALDNAKAAWTNSIEPLGGYVKNQGAWDNLQNAITDFNNADAAVGAILTPAQRTSVHDYWTSLVPAVLAEMTAINVSSVPGYVSGTDYTLQANIDTLGASSQKTQLTALRVTADGYLSQAAAALVPGNTTLAQATLAAKTTALLNLMTLYGQMYWALSVDPTNLNKSFTEVMAGQALAAQQVAASGSSGGGRYLYKGNVVYIPDMTGISITSGEEYMTLLAGSVQGPADLPRYAPLGTFLKMNPTPSAMNSTTGAVCYIQAIPLINTAITDMCEVTWEETCLNTEPSILDASSMPVIVDLIPSVLAHNTPSDTFNYWLERKAGDYKLCPPPLIIGNKITDIGRGANRLLLLGDNSTLTSSELGRRANIFRVSALQLYPTDPISTAISGERPAHLYKIVPWGMHIALLGTSSIFKFDVSQGIDATMIKISRACAWNGPKAVACPNNADLLLISSEGIHIVSYGVYGTRVELDNIAEHINLPAETPLAFYDPLRKTLFVLYQLTLKILVGWDLGKGWGWGWYSIPTNGNLIKGWLLTNNLRFTTDAQGLYELPLHEYSSSTGTLQTNYNDHIGDYNNSWLLNSSVSIPGNTVASVCTAQAPPGVLNYPTIQTSIKLKGADSLNLGWNRIAKATFTTRGFTTLNCNGITYNNQVTYSRPLGGKTSITDSIAIPWSSLTGYNNSPSLQLTRGEINLCTLSYYTRSTNTAPGG